MGSPLKFFTGLAIVGCAGVAGLHWQQQANAALREELAQREQRARAEAGLMRENLRLKSAALAPPELAARREERAALAALAREMETVRRRIAAPPAVAVAMPAAGPGAATPRPSLHDAQLGAELWTNAGSRDPLSAMETALWAAAHGNIEALTGQLIISEETRARAAAVVARLPAAVRAEVNSPEQLVAMLSASAVPLGGAQVLAQFNDTPESARLLLQLTTPDGQPRERMLTLRASAGDWRLVVPDAEIARYFAKLQEPAGP